MFVLPLAFICIPAQDVQGPGGKDVSAEIQKREIAHIAELRSYVAKSPSLPIDRAAAQWVELLERGRRIPLRPLRNGGNLEPVGSPTNGVSILPRPEAWPAIERLVSKRPDSDGGKVLQLLFMRLRGDDQALLKLSAAIPEQPRSREDFNGTRFDAFRRSRNLAGQISIVRQQISTPRGYPSESLPDLVSLVGEAEATRAINPLLDVARRDFYIDGESTNRLARRLVLARLKTLKRPQWQFADSVDDRAYVSKLVERFGVKSLTNPPPDENGGGSTAIQTPINIYFASLLLDKKIAQAADFARTLGYAPDVSVSYRKAPPGLLARVYPAVVELRKLAPELNWKDLYVQAAFAAGQGSLLAKDLEADLAKAETPSAKIGLLNTLVGVYARQGDSVALWRTFDRARSIPRGSGDFDVPGDELKFGLGLGNEGAIKRGITYSLANSRGDQGFYLYDALIRTKQYETFESLLKRLVTDERDAYWLCWLYHVTNRPKDLLKVFRESPVWGSDDLKDIVAWAPYQDYWGRSNHYPPYGYLAAWALAKTGEKEMAVDILRPLLVEVGTSDEAFDLLNSLIGAKALPFYDSLIRLDTSGPRPLIWKADLLRKLGRLDEAEAAAREAIRIDPSDAKAAVGHRFKVYEVLGQILKQKGQAAQAEASTNRMRAAQITERANELQEIGLLPQAISTYKEAIRLSPTDYVAEERLAQCLGAQGKLEEAGQHRRNAYRLLPSCVGLATEIVPECDSLILTDDSMRIGLPILAKDTSASGLYLKGVCEHALGNPKQAIKDYRKAVAKEPRFIVALSRLANLGGDGYLSLKDTEAAAFRALNLNPAPARGDLSFELDNVANLAPVYRAIAKGIARRPALPTFRFRLKRSTSPYMFGIGVPWRQYPPPLDRPAGTYLFQSRNVGQIASSLWDVWAEPPGQ